MNGTQRRSVRLDYDVRWRRNGPSDHHRPAQLNQNTPVFLQGPTQNGFCNQSTSELTLTPTMKDLSGKIAVVTVGSTARAELVRQLIAQGCDVAT